jgi:opacity protein-like surface antigen
VPVTPSIALLAAAGGMLLLATGPITDTTNYGHATAYGLDALAGVDIALTGQIGLRVALEYNQISLSFDGQGATKATNRDGNAATQDVMAAADRSIGLATTIGFAY